MDYCKRCDTDAPCTMRDCPLARAEGLPDWFGSVHKHDKPDPFILGAIIATCLVVGFGLGLAAAGDGWLKRPPIVSTFPRPPGSWRFQPQPDMTPAEAAASVSLMLIGPDFLPVVGDRIEAMPPELRRHWLAPETTGQEQAK